MKIIDNTGRIVVVQLFNNVSNANISVANLSKGIYIVQIKDSKSNVEIEKLVIE